MNTKRILGTVLALVCAVSFATAGVVSAGIPSASEQDKQGQENLGLYALIASDRSEAKAALSDILPLQRRLSRANGITITDQPFKNTNDYKTMMHPIIVGWNGNAAAGGGGYLYVGAPHLITYPDGHIKGEIGMLYAEGILSHEYGHSVLGHPFLKKTVVQKEYEADMKSFDLLKNLPEGGWGIHFLRIHFAPNYKFEKEQRIIDYIERETKKNIGFNVEKYGVSDTGNPLYHITALYRDSKNNTYPLYISRQYARNGFYGGQVAYCIAKGIFSPENLAVIPNSLKYDLKWDANYLLACRDSSVSGGYRVLAGLEGTQTQLQSELNTLKASFGTREYANMSDHYDNDFRPFILDAQGFERSKLILWQTVAFAYDCVHAHR